MSKHTPGPWQVDPQYPMDVQTADGKQEICVPFDEAQRDMLFTMPQTKVASGDEAFANARLIATAPELLSDLCDATATLRRYESLHRAKNTDESTAKAEVNAALAARFEKTIAKAKGITQ